jgi:peptide/nickel transport system ATP-binding protein
VAIARALIPQPELLICDEVTSALDTSVQAAIVELLNELQTELGLALLVISHDLGLVASISSRVIVLERGNVCEEGRIDTVLRHPRMPYTQTLLDSAPSLARETSTESDDRSVLR